jgi:X-linked retinitis pigmentosa GTPase regulator
MTVSCGDAHTLVVTKNNDAFAWGNNEFGQCGTGSLAISHYSPVTVNFDVYYKPNVKLCSAGSNHSGFVDEAGRLFLCGLNNHGQLGSGTQNDERLPCYVNRIPDKVSEVACGDEHTIVLTLKGEVYAMGANSRGQLGTGSPSKGCSLPTFLEELSFSKMVRVRAGAFSASISSEGQLYVWGEGTFGKFYNPHRIKSGKTLDIQEF